MKKIFIHAFLILAFLVNSMAFAQMVMFNTKTLKFHKLSCRHAARCTVNCIKIERKAAIKRGGIPCKTCGG